MFPVLKDRASKEEGSGLAGEESAGSVGFIEMIGRGSVTDMQPADVLSIGTLFRQSSGLETVSLTLPLVPTDQVEPIARACALAVLSVMGWPPDDAAAMAQRVCDDLARELADRRAAFLSRQDDVPL